MHTDNIIIGIIILQFYCYKKWFNYLIWYIVLEASNMVNQNPLMLLSLLAWCSFIFQGLTWCSCWEEIY